MKKTWLYYVTVLCTGILVWIIFSLGRPLGSLTWDLYQHAGLWSIIVSGNLSLLPTHLSDTFQYAMYTPLFAVCFGLLSSFLQRFLTLQTSWWLIEGLFYILCATLAFVFSSIWTNDRRVWLISGLIGALSFESLLSQSGFSFVPQTAASVIGLISLTLIIKRKYYFSVILISVAWLFHAVLGFYALSLAVILLLCLRYRSYLERIFQDKRKLIFLHIFFLVMILLLNSGLFRWDPFNTIESRLFTVSLIDKVQTLLQWYGGWWVLFFIGLFAIGRKDSNNLHVISIITLVQLCIILSPFPYVLKLYTLTRYFIFTIMSIGGLCLLDQFSQIRWRTVIGGSLLALLCINFYINQITYKMAYASYLGPATSSEDEISTALRLKEKYGSDSSTILISDPATMQVFEGISGINTPGGVFVRDANRTSIDNLFPSKSIDDVKTQLRSIRDLIQAPATRILFVIDGRFMAWQRLPNQLRSDNTVSIWAPRELSIEGIKYADMLLTDGAFHEVIRDPNIIVLELFADN
ncbi:hypothetical protein HGA91_03010 [candidate division WWE3 bacterium]|nr:hypothetical protein [candidate division WWE3 bacterium]